MRRLSNRLAILVVCLVLTACNMPARSTPTSSAMDLIYTSAAQTVEAQMTLISQPPPTGITPLPNWTPSPANTSAPVQHPSSATPAGTAPATAPAVCDRLKFIGDVTIPDDTSFTPGSTFVKTWRLQNAGTCTWNAAYRMVVEGTNTLEAPASLPVTNSAVAPGQTIDVSVNLKAPAVNGTYRTNFKLSNPQGVTFGAGDDNKPFWVQVVVAPTALDQMDFVSRSSSAAWRTGQGDERGESLAFGGSDDNVNGLAAVKDQLKLENGAVSGKVLVTIPSHTLDGYIQGVFPAYRVQGQDHFKARVGFATSGECAGGEYTFEIFYKEGDDIELLERVNKSCDGRLLSLDLPLTRLRGKTLEFILVVRADGRFGGDWPVWNSPRIER